MQPIISATVKEIKQNPKRILKSLIRCKMRESNWDNSLFMEITRIKSVDSTMDMQSHISSIEKT